MMRNLRCCVVYVVVLGAAVSCSPEDRVVVEEGRAAVIGAFQPITYRRLADAGRSEDRISVLEDGTIQHTGRSLGSAQGKLSEFQMMGLARVFEGWEKLSEKYPAPQGVSGAGVVEIKYGQKAVSASEAARDVPEEFLLARERLEMLVRDLPATQKSPGQ